MNVSPISAASRHEKEIHQDIDNGFSKDEMVKILIHGAPSSIEEYNEHIFRVASLLYYDDLSFEQFELLEKKFYNLINDLKVYIPVSDPIHSKLYLLIEKNFDIFIRLSTNHKNVDLSTKTIRFLTNIIMNLNYWELYNLLSIKPAIYHFLSVIQFDLNECYAQFIRDYEKFNYTKVSQPEPIPRSKDTSAPIISSPMSDVSSNITNEDDSLQSQSKSPSYLLTTPSDDHDKFVSETVAGVLSKEKKKIRVDSKLSAHRIIKKSAAAKPSNKSSNYDPDVVHECQLPSADEPDKLCLRRFSRKYELIRHQETVHSKKKKLFKCFVCVKLNPGVGPRIFTRHDTLAKHIRVNHKISGKEAKAEVAYSKKHAEVVEEGDITVHVGRRKTKVDFELRAHMEKRRLSKDGQYGEDSQIMESNSDSEDEMFSE